MQQNRRNVDAVWARHTIFAIVARNSVPLHHVSSHLLEEMEIVVGERFQWAICAQIILKMLHAGHSAEHCEHTGLAPGKAERPRSHTALGLALLQLGNDAARHIRQTSAKQRLHDYGRNSALFKLAIEILGIGVRWVYLLCIFPVEIVELNLNEVPFIFIVARQQIVEHTDIAVIGESEIANASRLALLNEEIENTILDVAILKLLHAASHAHSVKQHIVDVIHLKLSE